MHMIFYKTNDVFSAEEKIQSEGIEVEVVPTPVRDKAYCGVCLETDDKNLMQVKNVLGGMDYTVVE